MTLSKNPPRGTYDFFPEDFSIQKYIFDTWRKVCTGFGYQEYLGPIVEPAEIWRAKSGEDVGGTELTVITDRTGQPSELALRPEMTPTVTRMVSKIYNEVPKPIRYFSIANFYRNERPQRGRNREFWQLNYDLFGSESLLADVEIIQIAIELILAFDPPKNAFRVSLGNRKMLDAFLSDIVQVEPSIKTQVVRTMDKWEKLSREDFEKTLGLVGLKEDQREKIVLFLSSLSLAQFAERFPIMMENAWFRELQTTIEKLEQIGYGEFLSFDPSLIRGFDYYDGMIFEVFDQNPENTRSMFGGGRYNGLASLFGEKSFPAVGSGPGNETFRLFLEAWWLMDAIRAKTRASRSYIPLLAETLFSDAQAIAQSMRKQGSIVEVATEVSSLKKGLDYANRQGFSSVVIFGTDEKKSGSLKVKDMETGEERLERIP